MAAQQAVEDSQSVAPDSSADDEEEVHLSDIEAEDGSSSVGDSLAQDSQIDLGEIEGSQVEEPLEQPIPDVDIFGSPFDDAMTGDGATQPAGESSLVHDPVENSQKGSPEIVEISDTPVKDPPLMLEDAKSVCQQSRAEIEERIQEVSKQLNTAKKQLTSKFPGVILGSFWSFKYF